MGCKDQDGRRISAVVVMKGMARGSRKPMCGQLGVVLTGGGRKGSGEAYIRLVER